MQLSACLITSCFGTFEDATVQLKWTTYKQCKSRLNEYWEIQSGCGVCSRERRGQCVLIVHGDGGVTAVAMCGWFACGTCISMVPAKAQQQPQASRVAESTRGLVSRLCFLIVVRVLCAYQWSVNRPPCGCFVLFAPASSDRADSLWTVVRIVNVYYSPKKGRCLNGLVRTAASHRFFLRTSHSAYESCFILQLFQFSVLMYNYRLFSHNQRPLLPPSWGYITKVESG